MPRHFFSPQTPDPLWLWRAALVPMLTWLAISALAQAHGDLAARAELRFLGLLIALCLVCIGALTPKKALVEWTAAAAVAGAWCLAESAVKGSATSVLLVAALGTALWFSRATENPNAEDRHLALVGVFTASATAWQVLTRPDLLLAPLLDPRTLVSVGILPLLCGLALARLAKVHGEKIAWIAALAVGAVAPGFNVTVTMALLAVAAGSFLRDEVIDPRLRRVAAVVVLGTSLLAWPLSLPVALAALAGWVKGWRPLVAAAAALAIFVVMDGMADHGFEMVALALILLPCGVLAAMDMRRPADFSRWGLGLLLIAAATATSRDPEALAPGLLVLATLIRTDRRLQLYLSSTAACGIGLVAGYPWLHADPLLLIERPLIVGAVIFTIAGLWRFSGRLRFGPLGSIKAWSPAPTPAAILAVAASASLLFAPAAPLAVLQTPKVLDQAHPVSLWELPDATDLAVARALVDSNMVHGAHLEAQTQVAFLELLDAQGGVVAQAEILAGEHTADWAAGRPDIASLGLTVPEPFSKRPSPDRRFFEQRYRAVLELIATPGVTAIRIRRSPDLPPLTRLVVRRVELRS